MAPIPVATIMSIPASHAEAIERAGFLLHPASGAADRAELFSSLRGVRAVITNGTIGLKAAEIASLPELEVICVIGAGFEGVDLEAAMARGIALSHGPGTNAATVADHAMALLLAIARDLRTLDAGSRRGEWGTMRGERPVVSGKRLGLLGLGGIGGEIARRASAGFGMTVAYCSRTPREGSPYTYCPTPLALAARSDFLVVAAPGGAATRHIVDRPVLEALGPRGYLVNIGRGSVVATDDLVECLREKRIAGAALDVFENEPGIPPALLELQNLLLTPHVAGLSPEAVDATYALVLRNLQSFFAGQGVLTPIPAPT